MRGLEPEQALTIWRAIAMDVEAAKLYDTVELQAVWQRDLLAVAQSANAIPIAERGVRIRIKATENANVRELLDRLVGLLDVDPKFGDHYDARMDDYGRVVIA